MELSVIITVIVGITLTVLGAIGILNEQKLVKLERKLGRYIKAFLKALVYTINDKKQAKEVPAKKNSLNAEYEEILASLEAKKRYESNIVAIEDYIAA